jgi:hypothetical protein
VEQVLIQWSNGGTTSAIWEDREELRSHFPLAPAWGKLELKKEAINNGIHH